MVKAATVKFNPEGKFHAPANKFPLNWETGGVQ